MWGNYHTVYKRPNDNTLWQALGFTHEGMERLDSPRENLVSRQLWNYLINFVKTGYIQTVIIFHKAETKCTKIYIQ